MSGGWSERSAMRARVPTADMTPLALLILLLLACAAEPSDVNITQLIIPKSVEKEQAFVEFECHYKPHFDRFHYFKNNIEIFRYTKSPGKFQIFPPPGIGNITVVNCDSTMCIIRLTNLTEAASATYRCEVERFNPSYEYSALSDYMYVHSANGEHNQRPVVILSATLYGEGDKIIANCSGAPNRIRWYINKEEIMQWKDEPSMVIQSSKSLFHGSPPAIIVQCATYRKNGFLIGSRGATAYWRENDEEERPQEQRNNANRHIRLGLISVLHVLIVLFTAK